MSNWNKVNVENICKTAKDTTCFAGTKSSKYPRTTKNLIPPILKEQEEMVNKIEKHLLTISYLENQITEREKLIK